MEVTEYPFFKDHLFQLITLPHLLHSSFVAMCLKAGICSASLTSLGDEGRGAVALNPADWSRQSLDPVSTGVCPFHSSRSVSLSTKLSLGNGWSLICLPKKTCIYILNHCCVIRASFDDCEVLKFRIPPLNRTVSSLLFKQHDFWSFYSTPSLC